jgi:hypothetical protein
MKKTPLVVIGFAILVVVARCNMTPEQKAEEKAATEQAAPESETAILGKGGARVFVLTYIKQNEGGMPTIGPGEGYGLGLRMASQYCSTESERIEFARAFDAELHQIRGVNYPEAAPKPPAREFLPGREEDPGGFERAGAYGHATPEPSPSRVLDPETGEYISPELAAERKQQEEKEKSERAERWEQVWKERRAGAAGTPEPTPEVRRAEPAAPRAEVVARRAEVVAPADSISNSFIQKMGGESYAKKAQASLGGLVVRDIKRSQDGKTFSATVYVGEHYYHVWGPADTFTVTTITKMM